jgi:hypothetical protein
MSIFSTIKQSGSDHSDSKKVNSLARQMKELKKKAIIEKERARAVLIVLLDKGDRKDG